MRVYMNVVFPSTTNRTNSLTQVRLAVTAALC